ncbi:MAG: ACP S-malonyltransferase, partial [Nitriliruptoraceae bacterium]
DVSAASRLVGARGAAMAASCAANPGTMAAIVKLDPDALAALVADIPQLVVANDNAHGQAVVAGPHDAVDRVRDRAREAGGRAVPLDVEGAFHSPAMAEAVDKVAAALAALDIADPRVPLVSGASASALRTGTAIGDALVAGMLAPVRWREVQAELAAMGVTELLEVGPGGVLSGLAKRELAGVRVHRIEAPDDVADVVGALADHKCSEVAS